MYNYTIHMVHIWCGWLLETSITLIQWMKIMASLRVNLLEVNLSFSSETFFHLFFDMWECWLLLWRSTTGLMCWRVRKYRYLTSCCWETWKGNVWKGQLFKILTIDACSWLVPVPDNLIRCFDVRYQCNLSTCTSVKWMHIA